MEKLHLTVYTWYPHFKKYQRDDKNLKDIYWNVDITSIGGKTYTRQGDKAYNIVFMRGTSPSACVNVLCYTLTLSLIEWKYTFEIIELLIK